MMQLIKIETTTHGCVGMAHKHLLGSRLPYEYLLNNRFPCEYLLNTKDSYEYLPSGSPPLKTS